MNTIKLSVVLLASLPLLAAAESGPGRPGDTGASAPQIPGPCPAPIIKHLKDGAVFTKPDIYVFIEPAPLSKPPADSASVQIEQVDGGFSTQFFMHFGYAQGLGYLFGKKEDGTFPENAYGTYRLTAKTGSKESPSPGCLESAPRTFKIAAPPGPAMRDPRIPPLRDERKPNPTNPPPVEKMGPRG